MKAKHTPGPWFRDTRSGLNCDVRAKSGRNVALCWGLASNNATNYRADYRAECDANAHLIAAAPELLSELEAAHQIIRNALAIMTPDQKCAWGAKNETDGVSGEGTTRANERQAAISKAKGEA